MNILIVDDSENQRMLLQHLLKKGGFTEVILAESAKEAFEHLGLNNPIHPTKVDLILMDILMPEMNGIEACRLIKAAEHLRDIPIIMVTGVSDIDSLELAFAAGVMDYIVKPVKKVDLFARVRSLLKLKHEMDKRKARERELETLTQCLKKTNEKLERLSTLDGLTSIANRRYFNEVIEKEWRYAARHGRPLSLVMADIDFFKAFNDHYGHLHGDDCLKEVANAMSMALKRPGDILARYGGEEFVALLPDTDADGAMKVADYMHLIVNDLGIEHANSTISNHVTVSIGVATVIPEPSSKPASLIDAADKALFEAKKQGRNQILSVYQRC